jgi:hypothetical protein
MSHPGVTRASERTSLFHKVVGHSADKSREEESHAP